MQVLVLPWTESERGWGTRPDGLSIHFSVEQMDAYIGNYWKEEELRNPSGSVPDEYSRPNNGDEFWSTFSKEHADERITKLALQGESFRCWENSPKWLSKLSKYG